MSKRRISGMALLILALLQRIFLMSSLMLLLVWLIFFMVLIKLLPILGTISGKTVKLMVLALICLGNNRQRSEERFSRNAETDLVCRLLLEKKILHRLQILEAELGVHDVAVPLRVHAALDVGDVRVLEAADHVQHRVY